MLVVSDVHVLITYSMIVESFFIMLSVSSVLYFRYKRPDMIRPIKVRFFFQIRLLATIDYWVIFIFISSFR